MCCSLSVAVFAEWTPATLPNEKLTPQTYNEIVDKLNHELKRRDLTAGVELVSQGEGLSLRKYQQVLSGIERLKADSEAVSAKYNDTVFGKLPMANDISSGYPVNSQEFYKIRYLLTAAQGERIHGEVEDYGQFVLFKPQPVIKGVEPPSHRVYNGGRGVFVHGRTVTLSDYYISKYEVTYALWKQVYDWGRQNGYVFRNSGYRGSLGEYSQDQDPVTWITWLDCIVWCNAYTQMAKGSGHCVYVYRGTNQIIKSTADLTPAKVEYRQERKGYRLLTEAEWEYAARFQGRDSENGLEYSHNYLTHLDSFSGAKRSNQDAAECERVAWFGNRNGTGTKVVGQRAPNYAGLYDMSRNVYEWCYDDSYCIFYSGHNPIGGNVNYDGRVMRGGGWSHYPLAGAVGAYGSGYCYEKFDNVGFRIGYSR